MAEFMVHPHTAEEYNNDVMSVRINRSLYGSHALNIKGDNTEVTFFVSKAQLVRLANKIEDYLDSKCDHCDLLGADTYEHEGNEWKLCKSCESKAEDQAEAIIDQAREQDTQVISLA